MRAPPFRNNESFSSLSQSCTTVHRVGVSCNIPIKLMTFVVVTWKKKNTSCARFFKRYKIPNFHQLFFSNTQFSLIVNLLYELMEDIITEMWSSLLWYVNKCLPHKDLFILLPSSFLPENLFRKWKRIISAVCCLLFASPV